MENKNNYSDKLLELAKKNKLSHAIIIEDADSSKALKFAMLAAKISLCDSENNKPCDKCKNCVKMDAGSHTDVMIIEPEKEGATIKTETVRKIREDAYILSCEGKHKFYIIGGADFMTIQAQNAFIKILEEPPKNVVFVMICKSASSLLPTVRSRCQIYRGLLPGDAKTSDESRELAQKIVDAQLKNDVLKIMALVSECPNDRNYLKNLSENISEKLIYMFANKNGEFEKTIKTIDELSYLIKNSNNNINVNLFKCRIMASLIA